MKCAGEPILQTLHMYSTLKRRGNGRFHVVSTWNTRGVGNMYHGMTSLLFLCAINRSIHSPESLQFC